MQGSHVYKSPTEDDVPKQPKPRPIVVQARIEGGELKVPGRKVLLAALKHWQDGPCDLEVRPFVETRRAKQNAYYHAVVVKTIATETGHTPEQIHALLKDEFNAEMIEVTDPATGVVAERRIVRSTASLNVQDFADYITQCQVWAAEFLGLVIPEAEPDVLKRGKAA